MTDAIPALLALLLVVSLPAMAVVAAGPSETGDGVDVASMESASVEPTTVDDTTNRLELPGETRTEYTEFGTDLGTMLASTDDELRNDFDRFRLLDREFDDATTDERESMMRATHDHIQDRTDELEQREREVVRAHANGEVSDTELLQTLVRNYNEAETLSDSIDELRDREDEVLGFALSSDYLDADQKRLEMQQGSVRSLVESTGQGQTATGEDGQTIVVQTAHDGYRLTAMVEGTYVIETTRFDNRDMDGEDAFEDTREAFEHAETLYPWAMDDGSPSFGDHNRDPANLYHAEVPHSQGLLMAFIDSNNGEVYHEVQELNADSLPVSNSETHTDGGLEVTYNETPFDGPTEVIVADAETGEPVEAASVVVDGTELGETDADGSQWIVPPHDAYELEVETASGTANVTVG